MRLLRQPLLHFLAIGGVLFALDRARPPADVEPSPAVIEVTAAQIGQLREAWMRDSGRAPSDAELQASIRRHVDDEILVREALARGLDRSDPVVRERLLRNMRFLYPERRAGDDVLLGEAAALGMAGSDVVVRRRLLQVMERRLVGAVPVDAQALAAYRDRHAARYLAPARISFEHVYLSDDVAHRDPQATLQQLRIRLDRSETAARSAGDAFLLGTDFPSWTPAQVGARFGSAFADALAQAPEQAWTGPLRSIYGWHLVRVTARASAGTDVPPTLQAQLVRAWQDEARAQRLREELRGLRARYQVVGLPSARGAGPT